MAAGVIQKNVTISTGNTVPQNFAVDDTGTPTKASAGHAIIDSSGTAVAVKAASTAPAATDPALVVAISPNSVNANGQAAMAASAPTTVASDQKWQTGMSNRVFSVPFSTLTFASATASPYAAGDSISNNATAGSVTALVATVSDTNDDPIFISELKVVITDTGFAGKRIRAYLFNSDPTASSGVGAGDNAAYSQKVAGYVGSFSGILETGFSDGTVGRLVPAFNDSTASPNVSAPANGYIACKPSTGGKSLWIQFQAIDAITPSNASANTGTIIATAKGWQGRAA